MKKKGLLLVTSMLLVCAVAGAGVAYALWRIDAKSEDNSVSIGTAVVLSLDEEVYFTAVQLAEPGATSPITAITVTNDGEETYVLKIADFAFTDESTVTYTSDDLYIEVSDSDDMQDATAVKFENGAVLIASNAAASKMVYVRIGLGANPTVALSGKGITFSIVTAAA